MAAATTLGATIAAAFTAGLTNFGPDVGLIVAAVAGMYVTVRVARALIAFAKR